MLRGVCVCVCVSSDAHAYELLGEHMKQEWFDAALLRCVCFVRCSRLLSCMHAALLTVCATRVQGVGDTCRCSCLCSCL